VKARFITVFALAAGLTLLATSPALADDPVQLDGAYVADSAGVLGGDNSSVISSLDSLYEQAGIQLFVVYVDEFTNPSTPIDWRMPQPTRMGLETMICCWPLQCRSASMLCTLPLIRH